MSEPTIGRLTPSICNELSTCTEKAHLRYACNIKEDKSLGAVIGIQVHRSIEDALKLSIEGKPIDIVELQKISHENALKMIEDEDINIDKLYMPIEEQLKQMDYCISGYLQSKEFKSLQPQGDFDEIEHSFKYYIKPEDQKVDIIDVPKPDYLLLSGKTDFLEWNEDQKHLRIIDYKTGSSRFPWDILKVRKRMQFRVYAWILSKAFNVEQVDMVAHIINKSAGKTAKPVAIQEFTTTFSKHDLADCERQMNGFYQIVKNNIHFYCDNCPGYCSYKEICGKVVETKEPDNLDLDWVI